MIFGKMNLLAILACFFVLLFAATPSFAATAADPRAPDEFMVMMKTSENTSASTITLRIIRKWAPIGVDHFWALLQDKFYTNSAFFRVVPGFVVQFGIAGSPAMNSKWNTTIMDDPVIQSNKQWTITYATAGPNTRTTQLFINYVDNPNLDGQGFAPFGMVVKGMDACSAIFNPTPGNSNGVDQTQYMTLGNKWIKQQYPKITFISQVVFQKSSAGNVTEAMI